MELSDARSFIGRVERGDFTDSRIRNLTGGADPLELVGVGIERLSEPEEYGIVILLESQDGQAVDLANALADEVPGEVTIRFSGRFKLEVSAENGIAPLAPGISIGPSGTNVAGTLGCFVTLQSGDTALLSNAHVLTPLMNEVAGGAICQHGAGNGNEASIARVTVIGPVRRDVVDPIDAAAATILPGLVLDGAIRGLGMSFAGVGVGEPPERLVSKSGRTTGLTNGRVRYFDIVSSIDYPQGPVRLRGLTAVAGLTGRFTAPGDSGSAIFGTHDHLVYGLHVAGSSADLGIDSLSLYHPIDQVLARIGARMFLDLCM